LIDVNAKPALRDNVVVYFNKPAPPGPLSAETFLYATEPLAPLADREVRIEAIYFAIDAGARGMIDDQGPYVLKLQLGDRMLASSMAGRIVESLHPDWPVGVYVRAPMGARQRYVALAPDQTPRLMQIDPSIAPLTAYLGVLGVTGFTAWVGVEIIGRPRPGETVLVSAAGGAVGSAAGQIAKIGGARVVGIAGGPEKCALVKERFGFDDCVDYKAGDLPGQIARACPDGVDVYFDNVGGAVQHAAIAAMRPSGRVVICGQVAQYAGSGSEEPGPNLIVVLMKQLRIEGYLVSHHYDRFPEFAARSLEWLRAGKLHSAASVVSGMQDLHRAINSLMEGRNIGVQLHQVAPDPSQAQ